MTESLTIVKFAGGCCDYRLRIKKGEVSVETWHANPEFTGEDFIHDAEKTVKFSSTADAWAWIGQQLNLVPEAKAQ